MKHPKKHGRAYGNTQLTISIPTTLKERIAQEAADEGRSVSNWCVQVLKGILARQGSATAQQPIEPSQRLRSVLNEEPAEAQAKQA